MKYPNLADVLDTAAPGVDHSKILSYGCQCQFLDGRPLASAGNGHPVDEIDSACKQYRECQTCAQMDDGADCNVENVDWMYRVDLDVPQLDCLDPGFLSVILILVTFEKFLNFYFFLRMNRTCSLIFKDFKSIPISYRPQSSFPKSLKTHDFEVPKG